MLQADHLLQRTHAPVLVPVRPDLLARGAATRKAVALTFDACQMGKRAGYDERIIHVLRETGTPATLFLGGRWMETHRKQTRALAADPLFELGNHTYRHPHLTRLPPARVRAELQRTQDIMYALTRKQGVLFRPPFGDVNRKVQWTAAAMGLRTVMWTVETGDPDPHVTARAMTATVMRQVRPGAIIIMHVNGRGWHTAEALPTMIARLRKRGYRFSTVSQLSRPMP